MIAPGMYLGAGCSAKPCPAPMGKSPETGSSGVTHPSCVDGRAVRQTESQKYLQQCADASEAS